MENIFLNLTDVSKWFFTLSGKIQAVKNINLQIKNGDFFVLLGPSGCGKSTLLNLIAGLEQPSTGMISSGSTLFASAQKGIALPPVQRNVAMVFQSYALYPHMTAAKNLSFPLTNLRPKLTREEISRRIRETAGRLKITDLLERKPFELSGGQRQRVAIGRALVRNPKLLLMDEPLSNLDAQLRQEMRAFLKSLQHKLGITTIYVTHDQLEAMTLGTAICVLREGEIMQTGTPEEIYSRPGNIFTASFIGQPAMNLIPGNIKNEAAGYRFLSQEFSITLPKSFCRKANLSPAENYTLGIRPEHIQITAPDQGVLRLKQGVIENIGPEYLITFYAADTKITVKSATRPAEELSLKFDMSRVHVFNEQGVRVN